jgi:hypothetical protein
MDAKEKELLRALLSRLGPAEIAELLGSGKAAPARGRRRRRTAPVVAPVAVDQPAVPELWLVRDRVPLVPYHGHGAGRVEGLNPNDVHETRYNTVGVFHGPDARHLAASLALAYKAGGEWLGSEVIHFRMWDGVEQNVTEPYSVWIGADAPNGIPAFDLSDDDVFSAAYNGSEIDNASAGLIVFARTVPDVDSDGNPFEESDAGGLLDYLATSGKLLLVVAEDDITDAAFSVRAEDGVATWLRMPDGVPLPAPVSLGGPVVAALKAAPERDGIPKYSLYETYLADELYGNHNPSAVARTRAAVALCGASVTLTLGMVRGNQSRLYSLV